MHLVSPCFRTDDTGMYPFRVTLAIIRRRLPIIHKKAPVDVGWLQYLGIEQLFMYRAVFYQYLRCYRAFTFVE